MKYSQVKSDTWQTLQLNAGILVKGFDPSDGTFTAIMGATNGGLQFASNPEWLDFAEDIDNARKNTKQFKRLVGYDPTISGTFAACTPALAKDLLGAGMIDSLNSAHIIPVEKLTDADFFECTMLGDYSDVNTGASAGFMAVTVHNALNTAGFQWTSAKDAKGQFPLELHGHYDNDNPDKQPFDIYVKAGTGSTQPSIALNKHVLNISVDDEVQLSADVIPAGTTVTWSAGNTEYASVSSSGVVTGEGVGNTIITASITVNSVTYTDTCTVIVTSG